MLHGESDLVIAVSHGHPIVIISACEYGISWGVCIANLRFICPNMYAVPTSAFRLDAHLVHRSLQRLVREIVVPARGARVGRVVFTGSWRDAIICPVIFTRPWCNANNCIFIVIYNICYDFAPSRVSHPAPFIVLSVPNVTVQARRT